MCNKEAYETSKKYKMHFFKNKYIPAVFILFLIKLRWPKKI